MTTVVYTDGACSGNPGPGGWAWAVPGGAFGSGAEAHSTNQRMEIQAALEAVRANPDPVLVRSDSTYVVNCFRDRWWEGWLARGWTNSAKKPVANRDLWEPLIELVRNRKVTFEWVKGHSGDPFNDLVDRLAVEAATTQQARQGSRPPAQVGPPDDVAGRSAAPARSEPELPGYPIVVFGHRPTELGGYDHNPLAEALGDRLEVILRAKAELHDDITVVSGLRLGAELLGAEAAIAAELPLVAVLPYPEPQSVWPAAAQSRFAAVLAQARQVITLQKKVPTSKQQAGAALARRDAFLARNAVEAILVWDGQDPVLGRLFRSLEDHLGDDVWVLDPSELAVPPN